MSLLMIGTQKKNLCHFRCIKSLVNQLRNKLLLMERLLHPLGMYKNLSNNDISYFAFNWWTPGFWTIPSTLAVSLYFFKACFNVHPHVRKDQRMPSWLIAIAHSWLGYDLAHPLQESEMEIISKKPRYFVYKILDDWLGLTVLLLEQSHFLALKVNPTSWNAQWNMIVWLHEGPKLSRNIFEFTFYQGKLGEMQSRWWPAFALQLRFAVVDR